MMQRTSTMQAMSAMKADCINACKDAKDICEESIYHCIFKGGRFAEADLVGVLMDSHDIAEAHERYLLRNSPFSSQLGRICAERVR